MSIWYGEIEKRFNGEVSYESWMQDGKLFEEVIILLPNNEVHAVRVDHDDGSILVGVDGWTKFCSSDEISQTIMNRLNSHG